MPALQLPGPVWATLASAQGTLSRTKVGKSSEPTLDTSCHQTVMDTNCDKSNLTPNQFIKMSWSLEVSLLNALTVLSLLPAYLGGRGRSEKAEPPLYSYLTTGQNGICDNVNTPYKDFPSRGYIPAFRAAQGVCCPRPCWPGELWAIQVHPLQRDDCSGAPPAQLHPL